MQIESNQLLDNTNPGYCHQGSRGRDTSNMDNPFSACPAGSPYAHGGIREYEEAANLQQANERIEVLVVPDLCRQLAGHAPLRMSLSKQPDHSKT